MTPDKELMQRIHQGDADALDELLRRFWTPLVAYATRLLGDQDRAEDVVQETMLRVWDRRTDWAPGRRLRGFLYQITRNLALNERARAKVRRQWADRVRDQPQEPVPTPAEITHQHELRKLLDAAVEALPDRRREVFVLSRYHGHSYPEIADVMGISRQTVANQMSAALEHLRARLESRVDEFIQREHVPDGPSPGSARLPSR